MPGKSTSVKIYQLKLTVKGIRPPIWRRILIRSDVGLARLHLIVQSLMSWYGYHLYAYLIAEEEYGPPLEDGNVDGRRRSVAVRLSSIFGKGIKTITYFYDFGDGWEIKIQFERLLAGWPQTEKVICVAGARRGPAEDSGGPYGYQQKIDILKDTQHPEHMETREWIGDYFDPEAFDLKETNDDLSKL